MERTLALKIIFTKGKGHQAFYILSQEPQFSRQLDNQIILENPKIIQHFPKQRLNLRLLHNKIPILQPKNGLENTKEIPKLHLSFRLILLPQLLTELIAIQLNKAILPLTLKILRIDKENNAVKIILQINRIPINGQEQLLR